MYLGVDVRLGVEQDLHALVVCLERCEVQRGRTMRWVGGVDLGALGEQFLEHEGVVAPRSAVERGPAVPVALRYGRGEW